MLEALTPGIILAIVCKQARTYMQWRTRMAISAKELAKLIGVTERSVHRAEQNRQARNQNEASDGVISFAPGAR